jgi:hypothetical protein
MSERGVNKYIMMAFLSGCISGTNMSIRSYEKSNEIGINPSAIVLVFVIDLDVSSVDMPFGKFPYSIQQRRP